MASFKQQLASGVFYTAIAKYSGIIVTLVVSGVLGRLILPEDFGVVAISTVIIAFFANFSNMGISAAIIQHKELTKDDLSSIFSFTVWLSILLTALFFLAAWPIASYYQDNVLINICRLLSINLFFASINIVPTALLYRDKRFRYLAFCSLAIQVASGGLAIAAALTGWGINALLVNPILSSILLFIISYRKYPLPFKPFPKLDAIRKIFNYSAFQFLFNLVNYFSNNFDKLIIGKMMGKSMLGFYEKSYRLMQMPIQNITYVISPVLHPIFSDFQNDKFKLASYYEKIVRIMAFIGFPLSVILFFTAKELILIIFGNQWMPSVAVFQIYAVSVGVQIIISSSGAIFQAAGDTRSLFICGLFSAVMNVLGVLAGIMFFGTLEAVTWCLCTTYTINFIQCYWQMYYISLKQPIRPFIRQLMSPILCSIIIVLLLYPTSLLLENENLFLSLIIKGFIFVAATLTYIQITKEYDILKKIKELKNKLS